MMTYFHRILNTNSLLKIAILFIWLVVPLSFSFTVAFSVFVCYLWWTGNYPGVFCLPGKAIELNRFGYQICMTFLFFFTNVHVTMMKEILSFPYLISFVKMSVVYNVSIFSPPVGRDHQIRVVRKGTVPFQASCRTLRYNLTKVKWHMK